MADNGIKTEEDIYSEDEASSQFSSMLNAAAKKLSEDNAASVQVSEASADFSDSPSNTVKSSSGVLSQEEIERLLMEDDEPQSSEKAQPAPEKREGAESRENSAEYKPNPAEELEDAAYSSFEEADDTEKIASMLTAGFEDEEEPKKEAPAPGKKEKKPRNLKMT